MYKGKTKPTEKTKQNKKKQNKKQNKTKQQNNNNKTKQKQKIHWRSFSVWTKVNCRRKELRGF